MERTGRVIEAVYRGIYRLEVPLPNNPLRAMNSYIIKAPGRNLIIDTGMNRKECIEVTEEGLGRLNINLADTDFFVTHMHSDHCGLVSDLAAPTSRIYCSQLDGEVINSGSDGKRMVPLAATHGFPDPEDAIAKHPGFKYNVTQKIRYNPVKDRDLLTIGDCRFMCIATPGHTRGHICLYETKDKLLVAGDHILKKITPNISLWSYTYNPLRDYLMSLDKVDAMDVNLVLPGHRMLIENHRQRIDQLKIHHKNRAAEILTILQKGEQDAYTIATQMKWDLSYENWDEFPIQQKWFATGEVISHLKYLEETALVTHKLVNQVMKFSLIH